ncbi:MAG: hypothetical protein Q8L15_07620 [Methylobacter sp.]|nr:hypothetical protein [Methylobacter sp.]
MQFDAGKKFLEEAGFEVIDYYRPLGKPKHEQSCLAIVAIKPMCSEIFD